MLHDSVISQYLWPVLSRRGRAVALARLGSPKSPGNGVATISEGFKEGVVVEQERTHGSTI